MVNLSDLIPLLLLVSITGMAMCSLYPLDTYKRDNILLKVYKGESRGVFTNLLHTSHEIGDAHD